MCDYSMALVKDSCKYLQCLQLHLFASVVAAAKPNRPLGGEDCDVGQLIFNVTIEMDLHVCVYVQWEVNGSHLTQSQTLAHLLIE